MAARNRRVRAVELRNQQVELYRPLVKYNAERIWARLPEGVDLDDLISAGVFGLMDAIDGRRHELRGLRGEARAALFSWLEEQDRLLIPAAPRVTDAEALETMRREAEDEVKPFRTRMPPEAWRSAVETALDRLVRERTGLPRLAFD